MAITKVTGHVIEPTTNIQAGIITATRFDGPLGAGVTGDGANFSGIVTSTHLNVTGVGTFNGIGVTSLNVSGVSTFSDTTESNSATTGSVKLAGGLGVVKNIYTSGGAYVQGSAGLTVTHNITANGNIVGDNSTNITGIAGVTASTLTGTLQTAAQPNITSVGTLSSLDVTGSVSIGGTLTYEDVTNIDSVGLITARTGIIDSTLTAGRVTYAGTNGRLTDSANLTFNGSDLLIDATTNAYKGVKFDNSFNLTFGSSSGSSARLYLKGTSNGQSDAGDTFLATGTGGEQIFRSNTFTKFEVNADSTTAEALRITADGQLGVNNATPDAWHSQYKSLQIYDAAVLYGSQDDSFVGLGANHFLNTNGDFKYSNTDFASRFYQVNGEFVFESAASGSAGSTFGFTEKVKIDATGHVMPGTANAQDLGSVAKEFRNLYLGDSGNIKLGSDQDAEIYHNGSSLYMNNGTGNFYIRSGGGQVLIRPSNSYDAIVAKTNEVELYYNQQNHSTPKLKTTATGVTVDGEVVASQDYPTIRPTLDLNFAAVKKLDPRITFYGRTAPASYVDEYGVVQIVGINVPRFDHDPVTRESKGLLLEPNCANWIKYGIDLSGTGWTVNNVTNTLASTVVAPDGTTGSVWECKENSSTNYHATYYSANIPATNNQYYTVSSWVKKGPNYRTDVNSGRFKLYCSRGTGSVAYVSLDPTFTSIAEHSNTTSRSLTQYPNGWLRVTYTFQCNQTASNVVPHWLHGNGGSYAGNGSSSVYIWGCQFEQLIYPTTYIHTDGAIVYRGTETCLIDGTDFSDFYNTEESSLYVEGNIHVPTSYAGQYNIIHIGDSNNDGHGIFRESGSKDAWYHLRSGGNTPSGGNLNPSGYGDWGDGQSEAKIAIAFKSGDQAISVNGGNQVTATVSSNYPSANISKMWIGSTGTGGAQTFSGTISRIIYYPKQLTDAQLNTLTAV